MTAHVMCEPGGPGLMVMVPMVSADGLAKGMLKRRLRPGESFFGHT